MQRRPRIDARLQLALRERYTPPTRIDGSSHASDLRRSAGDLIHIKSPDRIDDDVKELVAKLDEAYTDDVRADLEL